MSDDMTVEEIMAYLTPLVEHEDYKKFRVVVSDSMSDKEIDDISISNNERVLRFKIRGKIIA